MYDIVEIVDIWTSWCKPCLLIESIMEDLVKKYIDKIKVTRINVNDENQETLDKYKVKTIPTILFFKNGEVVNRVTGIVSKRKIEQIILKLINLE